MMRQNILVVDDEPSIREMIADGLQIAGYSVFMAESALAADRLLREKTFDLIISDINMPKVDGYKFLDRIRSRGEETPVIFLTARNERLDVNQGLRLGADDYITKPFGLEELALRCAAVLRRTSRSSSDLNKLSCGPLVLDEQSHKVFLNEEEIDLSRTEFRLLQILLENKNKVLTKEILLDRIWGLNFTDSTAVVDTYISYLRKKIHKNGFEAIKTIRGVGFQILENK